MKTKTGLDVITNNGATVLHGQNIGLVVHPASVNSQLEHTVNLFLRDKNLRLCKLFGPQHGILGQTQDNMIEWEGFTDERTGLIVYSLYGVHRKPTAKMLDGIDTLVFDLQDVGARYYTFIWTMLLCMEACAENGKNFVVLDRPNPINCTDREGNILDMDFKSFVGLAPIPMRHGMTNGELAIYFKHIFGLELNLEVVWMENYHRRMWFEDTGLPWGLPSPNMPTNDTACVYPGMCLLEGTNLSEGRGTTRPFEIFGAPFIDSYVLTKRLSAFDLPGVIFRPLYFQPTFNKFVNELCGGAHIHVTDRSKFRSVITTTAVLSAIHELYPHDFRWKNPPYEYEEEIMPIDILAGTDEFRKAVEAGKDLDQMEAEWQLQIDEFNKKISGFLHYE